MPRVGEVTTTEITVKLCKKCDCVIGDTGLCSFKCPLDGGPHPAEQVITRVYERTDRLARES